MSSVGVCSAWSPRCRDCRADRGGRDTAASLRTFPTSHVCTVLCAGCSMMQLHDLHVTVHRCPYGWLGRAGGVGCLLLGRVGRVKGAVGMSTPFEGVGSGGTAKRCSERKPVTCKFLRGSCCRRGLCSASSHVSRCTGPCLLRLGNN